MAEKKYILAILPETNTEHAEKILSDFESRNNDFAIIRLTSKVLYSKFGYFLSRKINFLTSLPFFNGIRHLYLKAKIRISLKSRKKKVMEGVNPQILREGNGRGSKRVFNASHRFTPKLIICFDAKTLSKLVYAKRKKSLNVKIAYVELKAKFNTSKLYFNCDAYLVQNKKSKTALIENSYSANKVYVVNSYSLFKIFDGESKKTNDKRFFASVLLNANQFPKRIVRKIIKMFLNKHKSIKVYISTGIDRKLLTYIENIHGVKDNKQFVITGNKDKFFKDIDYSIQNTAYGNFAYSVANDIIPVVLSMNKVIKSESFEFYKENNIAVCVKNVEMISKMLETLLDDGLSESVVRNNDKLLIIDSESVTNYDCLLELANKLDFEQQI